MSDYSVSCNEALGTFGTFEKQAPGLVSALIWLKQMNYLKICTVFKVTGPIQNRCVNTMLTTFHVFFSVVLPELNEKSLFIFSSCLVRFTFDLYGEVTVALIQKDIEKYLWSISHAIFSTWQFWRIRSQGWKDKMAIRNLIVGLHESFEIMHGELNINLLHKMFLTTADIVTRLGKLFGFFSEMGYVNIRERNDSTKFSRRSVEWRKQSQVLCRV